MSDEARREAMLDEAMAWLRKRGIPLRSVMVGDMVDFALAMLGDAEPATTTVERKAKP